ncbi:MAG: alpha/beta hydrolase [Thermodesulfobacteriota bacterium]
MRLFLISALILSAFLFCQPLCFGNAKSKDGDLTIQVGDIRMAYHMYGSGDPLVMIMGYGSTMNLWESRLIELLSSRFQVILFDHRGIGDTETGQRPFTIEQFADDTAGLLQALGIKKAHLLGWSMGGLIAQETALRHSSVVNKLVLYAAHCNAGMFPPAPQVIQKLTDTSGTPEEQGMRFISLLFPPAWLQTQGQRVKEIFFRPLGKTPPETMAKQSQAIDQWKGCCDRLGSLTHPTLVMAGAEDQIVPPQNARFLAEKIPNARLILFEKTGHGLMFQDPEGFGKTVIDFLKN